MLRILTRLHLFVFIVFVSACEQEPRKVIDAKDQSTTGIVKQDENTTHQTDSDTTYKAIEWVDLIPEDDLEALLNPPSYVTEIEDGSLEDQISLSIQNKIAAANDDRYQQALTSTKVVPEMNDQSIRIPGFIVPLEFDEEQNVTQFFLVPFFGACIHEPPPPPNQIIFVEVPDGIEQNSLYDAFWVSGTLKTSIVENEMAKSAYSIENAFVEIYKD